MKRSSIAYATLAGVCLAFSMTWANSLVRAQESTGAYKIGVVDVRQVFQSYNRREAQFRELLEKRDAAEAQIVALAEKINSKRRTYEDQKLVASPQTLADLEMQILTDISNLEAERTRLQAEVSLIEDQKLKALNDEIRLAIAEIGQAQGYHLILESGAQTGGPVLYSATPLNLTPAVIDRLNK